MHANVSLYILDGKCRFVLTCWLSSSWRIWYATCRGWPSGLLWAWESNWLCICWMICWVSSVMCCEGTPPDCSETRFSNTFDPERIYRISQNNTISLWNSLKWVVTPQHATCAEMKQLDVVVNPPAFLWDPYLTLTHVIFDLDICNLWPIGHT